MEDGQKESVALYHIVEEHKLNKKKVLFVILCIIVLILLILTIKYCIRTMEEYKVFKQYEAQLQSIQHQEQEKQAKIQAEKERKRQEKIPKLTEVREKQY